MLMLKVAAVRRSRPTADDRVSSLGSVPKKSPKKAANSDGNLTFLKKKKQKDIRKK